MSLQNWYNVGSASVTNGQTTVTGQNTLWTQGVRAGDAFGTHVAGARVRIAAVVSDTELTLAYPWAGPTQNNAAYEIEVIPDRSRVQETTRRILEQLSKQGFFRADATSAMAPRSAYDNARIDFYWLDLDTDPVQLWYKQSNAEGDWAGPLAYLAGATGPSPNLTIAATETGEPGTDADVDITGVSPNYALEFTIPAGRAATLEIGQVDILNPGQTPTVQNAGDASEAVLEFGLPRATAVALGQTDTLAPGTAAAVTNVGTANDMELDFGIPRGANGWAFEPAIVNDGARRVLQVADFIGGEGSKPGGTGLYVGPAGLTAEISEAISIRGGTGLTGPRGVNWRGPWVDSENYEIADLVTDEDGDETVVVWIAIAANSDSRPRDNPTDWEFFPGSFASVVNDGVWGQAITSTLNDGIWA